MAEGLRKAGTQIISDPKSAPFRTWFTAADRLRSLGKLGEDRVAVVTAAEGALLDRVLDTRYHKATSGLQRRACGILHAARMKTSWGQRHQRTLALIEGPELLASAERYDLTGTCEGRTVRICAIGSAHGETNGAGAGHARELVDRLIAAAAQDGAEIALLFSDTVDDAIGEGFEPIPGTDVMLAVAQSPRHGAPMTMVRAGEERDLAAIVAMGRARAAAFRFHLDRDVDFVQYALTSKRLLAGLGTANARQLHFFIAEEGITAAAYVVLSVAGAEWTLEECGDRDASGARVGALLQALIAREPMEQRPTIRGWLPHGFVPPQVTIASAAPSAHTIKLRRLDSTTMMPPLAAADVLWWRSDVF